MEERLRILLCEDDENLGMLLREYLQARASAPTSIPTEKPDIRHFSRANMILPCLM